MKAIIVSLESFQKGTVPEEVWKFIFGCREKPFIVLDESSKIKTTVPCRDAKKSKRTQAVLKLGEIYADRCILTGTFMSKSPVNAYDQMNFLKPDFFPESMTAFAEKYTIRRNLVGHRGTRVLISPKDYEAIYRKLKPYENDSKWLRSKIESVVSYYGVSDEDCIFILRHKEYTPFKNLDDLWARIGDTCLKIDRNQAVDMPPKIYRTVKLELTREQKKLYAQLEGMYCTDKVTVKNGLELYIRFQDVCNGYEPELNEVTENVMLVPLESNPKIDALCELIDEIGDEQAVVWCSRTQLLYDAKSALERLGYSCGVYDGKIGRAEREEYYSRFTEKKIQVLFCNQASAAYGLDGLKDCDYAIYLCNDYSVEKRTQSEARIYRGLVERNKYIIDITFPNTCEARVTEALLLGKELLSTGEASTDIFRMEEQK